MKTYFIFSDVHSYYDELMKALNEAGFDRNNKNHYIISLGDLTDRGSKPKECLEFAIDMYKEGRALLIKGNHEDLMEEAICRREFWSHDYHNCTHETAQALTGLCLDAHSDFEILSKMKENELWNTYINSTINYAEIGDNIFVHGWIPLNEELIEDEQYKDLPKIYWPTKKVLNPNWRKVFWADQWQNARWTNGMSKWHEGLVEPGKTFWVGHIHASWGNSVLHGDGQQYLNKIETYYIDPETGKQEPHVNYKPFIDDGIVGMDGCTALSGIVNVMTLEVEND